MSQIKGCLSAHRADRNVFVIVNRMRPARSVAVEGEKEKKFSRAICASLAFGVCAGVCAHVSVSPNASEGSRGARRAGRRASAGVSVRVRVPTVAAAGARVLGPLQLGASRKSGGACGLVGDLS